MTASAAPDAGGDAYRCRSCGSTATVPFLDLGTTPLADRLLTDETLIQPEPVFPLAVVLCEDCALVQITETVDPDILFADDYPYYSSFSPALLEHSRANVVDVIERRGLGPDNFVVEVASNDGYLLKNYVDADIPVLGIDPAEGPVQSALEIGVDSICEFFGTEVAERLASEGKRADVIHGNNVLAHVADTNGFVAGLATLVKTDGVIVIEAPYVRDLIEHTEFDTIYHEHLCYLSATSVKNLMARHGLTLNDHKWLPIHGGSLRYYISPTADVTPETAALLDEERSIGLDKADFYASFGERVEKLRSDLVALVGELKAAGHSIAAYGAAAKGATLINYIGLGTDVLDFVVDRNVHKQGLYMPGMHLPIKPPEALVEQRPDYVLVLAWNFLDEILAQQSEYLDGGGRFIRPVPTPEIVETGERA